MYNHTIIIKNNDTTNTNDNLFFFITCLGAILYSLSEIFNINIYEIIQNRFHLLVFNYVLLLASIMSIIKISIFQKLLFYLIYNIIHIMLV